MNESCHSCVIDVKQGDITFRYMRCIKQKNLRMLIASSLLNDVRSEIRWL